MAPAGPPPGIYVPTLCFFKPGEKQEVDYETIGKHAVRLIKAGITGLVVHGTTGEPPHLSRAERAEVIKVTRSALDSAGLQNTPLIIGCGVSSTWETIDLCKEAKEAGGNFVIVIAPAYFKAAMSDAALEKHYTSVASASPLPMLLYNFPGVANGIDLDFPIISKLAKHPNIVGIKLSCGNVAKAARLAATYPPSEFSIYGGLADGLLAFLINGGQGVIVGLGNITPKAVIRVFDAFQKGDLEGAKKSMKVLALAGEIELKGGIPGMRAALQHFYGYGGSSRLPMLDCTEEQKKQSIDWVQPLVAGEK